MPDAVFDRRRALAAACPHEPFPDGIAVVSCAAQSMLPAVSYNDAMNQDPDPHPEREDEHGVVLAPARPEVQLPSMYRVLLLNDDYTPMNFVVEVLQLFFSMNRERATQVMLHVHTRGQGVCGVFTRDVAETKVVLVNEFAHAHQHPLCCTMEEA